MMKIPVVRQYSYWALTVHVIILAVLIGFLCWREVEYGVIFLILLMYYGFTITLRGIVAPAHVKGMRLIKRENYEEAIVCFQCSYDYFERHQWVDRFRFITMFSCSGVAYREMALCNIAFCYGQLGEGEKAGLYYQKVLDQFPDNMLAKMSLNLINSLLEKSRKQDDASGTV